MHRGIPKGAALGAPLVTFPRDGKVTRVQGGAPASRVERRGGCNPPRKRGAQRGGAPRKRKPCQMLNLTLNKPAPQYRGVAVNDAGLPRCGRALRRIKDHLRPPVAQQGDRRGGVRRAGAHLYQHVGGFLPGVKPGVWLMTQSVSSTPPAYSSPVRAR